MNVSVIMVLVLVSLLVIKLYLAKNLSGKPECYGCGRSGDTRALNDCETCDLYYECEKAARERWG